jgi:hypothetical protein
METTGISFYAIPKTARGKLSLGMIKPSAFGGKPAIGVKRHGFERRNI